MRVRQAPFVPFALAVFGFLGVFAFLSMRSSGVSGAGAPVT